MGRPLLGLAGRGRGRRRRFGRLLFEQPVEAVAQSDQRAASGRLGRLLDRGHGCGAGVDDVAADAEDVLADRIEGVEGFLLQAVGALKPQLLHLGNGHVLEVLRHGHEVVAGLALDGHGSSLRLGVDFGLIFSPGNTKHCII